MSRQDADLDERAKALAALHPDYCRREKLYRMCVGCWSTPVSYENDIIELEIRLTEQVLREPKWKQENVIRGLVRNWREAIPTARGYRAHIYRAGRARAGFLLPADNIGEAGSGANNRDSLQRHVRGLRTLAKGDLIDMKIDERKKGWEAP